MNTSLNWLTDYVQVDLPADQLGEIFTNIGLNCDGIEFPGNDVVFDLEVTSNRPDWLGHIGIARELAAATEKNLKLPKIKLPETAGNVEDFASVEVQNPALCPRYTARVIRNVKVGPSPAWLVERLEAIGLRSVNNIVDITNYVLMEYAQPLHAFDLDKLAGNKIIVRNAVKGEKLTAIDETTCELTENMLVIADADKPVAVAGVMGGLDSEVTESTVNILLESAQFDPLTTRKTSRKLGLFSDSNYRFERGVDPVELATASDRACALICELAGGEIAEGMIDIWEKPWEQSTIDLRISSAQKLLGIEVPSQIQVDILQRLGFEPVQTASVITCKIPSYRWDISREADLIEEVARMYGYDKIPVGNKVTHRVVAPGEIEILRRLLGSSLTASGYDEAVTFSFCDAAEAKLFGFEKIMTVDAAVRKTNNALRPTLAVSLLKAAKSNQDYGTTSVKLFELSAVFPAGDGTLPEEYTELALLDTADLRELQGAVEYVISRVNPEIRVEFVPAKIAGLDEDVTARIMLDGEAVGLIGRVNAKVQKHYGLEKAPAVATLRFDALQKRANLVRTAQVLPKFPGITRDLSLIVDEAVRWGELREVVESVTQPLRAGFDYVTTYRGKPLAKGKKSVTMQLQYRWEQGTLTSKQVDDQIAELLEAFKAKIKFELRS